MNVLFIMADQLRWDHLGCAGHPYLKTPNIDALARRGVRFANAFVNSGVCGPSRMSYYTGRYPISHGATWNRVPLSVGEITLGEMLRGAGPVAGAGRQDARDARPRRAWRGCSSRAAASWPRCSQRGGFEEIDRYDGHHAPGAESRLPGLPARARLRRRRPVDRLRDLRRRRRGPRGQRLAHAQRAPAGARDARSTPRPPT